MQRPLNKLVVEDNIVILLKKCTDLLRSDAAVALSKSGVRCSDFGVLNSVQWRVAARFEACVMGGEGGGCVLIHPLHWFAQGGFRLANRCFLKWAHRCAISFRLFRLRVSLALRISNFSAKQRAHVFWPALIGSAFTTIDQWISAVLIWFSQV